MTSPLATEPQMMAMALKSAEKRSRCWIGTVLSLSGDITDDTGPCVRWGRGGQEVNVLFDGRYFHKLHLARRGTSSRRGQHEPAWRWAVLSRNAPQCPYWCNMYLFCMYLSDYLPSTCTDTYCNRDPPA